MGTVIAEKLGQALVNYVLAHPELLEKVAADLLNGIVAFIERETAKKVAGA